MVHERDRLEREVDTRKMEAEANKISAETRMIEAQTARMAAVASAEGGAKGDWFRLTAVGADGRCSPMPTGLSPPLDQHLGQVAGVQPEGVKHMRCDKSGTWSVGPVEGHGHVKLQVSICEEVYGELDPPRVPPRSTPGVFSVLADTGAQMCVTGIGVALQLGLKARDLVPCNLRINGANNSGLDVLCAMFVTMSKDGLRSKQMVYVSRGV